jgi:hypothetical protein
MACSGRRARVAAVACIVLVTLSPLDIKFEVQP